MIIKNKQGEECEMRKKVQVVGSIRVAIGKKTPNNKPSKFWHGYEESTGHWVGIGSTEQECKDRIEKSTLHIDKIMNTINNNGGGLFG